MKLGEPLKVFVTTQDTGNKYSENYLTRQYSEN